MPTSWTALGRSVGGLAMVAFSPPPEELEFGSGVFFPAPGSASRIAGGGSWKDCPGSRGCRRRCQMSCRLGSSFPGSRRIGRYWDCWGRGRIVGGIIWRVRHKLAGGTRAS